VVAEGWFVYILDSPNGKGFYTGMTNNPERRLAQHNAGKGARFTRGTGPWRIVYLEPAASKSDALRREAAIKRLTRAGKKSLIARYQP
jgi:putative endonuclease